MTPGSVVLWFFGGLLPLLAIAYLLGRRKAMIIRGGGKSMRSQPEQYGWFATVYVAAPSVAAVSLMALADVFDLFHVPYTAMVALGLLIAACALWITLRAVQPDLQARNRIEVLIRWLLLAAAMVSILTTLGIVVSILFEAIRFFGLVSFWEFITGTNWAPDTPLRAGAGQADPVFGAVPLFAGTFMITAIAMAVAIPIGLLAAIFMAEYAGHRVRGMAKPVLEILAGIPTVVYGFFAAITVAPLIVRTAEALGLEASFNNALAPGVVMGIMIIPFISSLSDDVINAVPDNIREGSYALGLTHSETIKDIILPAALPGIVSAALLGVSRALGETMIVVMAAGLRPNLTANPLEDMTTVTVRIVDALTGDQAFDSPETLAAFALGLVLFVVTLSLNLVSTITVRRFRQRYE